MQLRILSKLEITITIIKCMHKAIHKFLVQLQYIQCIMHVHGQMWFARHYNIHYTIKLMSLVLLEKIATKYIRRLIKTWTTEITITSVK